MIQIYEIIKNNVLNNDWYTLLFMVAGGILIYLVVMKIILPFIYYLIRKSPTKWDDLLVKHKVLCRLAIIPSLLFVREYTHLLSDFQSTVDKLLAIVFVWAFVLAVNRFILVINEIYDRLPQSRGKSIKGYIQILAIITYIIGGLIVVSILINQSPWVLLSGLGAISAILLLIFKDTILSFVASVRISGNNMIELGDWIEMPQYGADGEVIDIALHNLQIQNWDKTITSIPTHRLLEESFKNWKGMHKAGGRRIMRSISIDLESVKFCDDEMLEKFARIRYLKDYIEAKKKEIREHNEKLSIDQSDRLNGRHLTNIGTFRAYMNRYLENHPGINQDLLKMTRLMEPGPNGVPLQIYAFTKDTLWIKYEATQSDIFDHILAILPEFGLRMFQNPTGHDFNKMISR